jgi:hypothetical protein
VTLADNPLRAIAEGGVGYCYDFDRSLFVGAGELIDGPLLLGLDSNVIFDLERHGSVLLEPDEPIVGADAAHIPDLHAIGDLMEEWFIRDIRFVLLPSTWTDYKRPPSSIQMRARTAMFTAIEEALSFQLQDWGDEHHRFRWQRPEDPIAAEVVSRVPDPLDRGMIESAWRAAVDVFVTSDARLRKRVGETPPGFPNVWSPRELVKRLPTPGLSFLSSGTIDHPGCPWEGDIIMGDMGRMSRLLEVLG